jgi:hypothetical protein
MHRCETCPLSGTLSPSQWIVPQRQVPVAPVDIGAGTLEHLRQRFGLLLELVLLRRAQLAQGSPRLQQRGAKALGQRTKRLASAHRASLGYTRASMRE